MQQRQNQPNPCALAENKNRTEVMKVFYSTASQKLQSWGTAT
jgi:hypothetical protein